MTSTTQSCNLINNVNKKNINTIESTTYENDDNESSVCLDELWLYYQDFYESNDHHTINVFQTKLLSKSLRRLPEIIIHRKFQINKNNASMEQTAMKC